MFLLIDIIRLALALEQYSSMASVPDPDHADIAEAKGLWWEVERQVKCMVGYCDGAPNWDALGGQPDSKKTALVVEQDFTDTSWVSTTPIPF